MPDLWIPVISGLEKRNSIGSDTSINLFPILLAIIVSLKSSSAEEVVKAPDTKLEIPNGNPLLMGNVLVYVYPIGC